MVDVKRSFYAVAMVQANDLKVAGMSFAMKKKPTFKNAPSLLSDSKL